MKFRRVPFPKYLNRPRLWLLFEEDEIKFILMIDTVVTVILFAINVPPFVYILFLSIASYLSLKVYREIRKKLSSNSIDFFFYELGIYAPKKKKKKDINIPYGFVKRLID